jgi:DNA-binding NarL/FixJ family response regulator
LPNGCLSRKRQCATWEIYYSYRVAQAVSTIHQVMSSHVPRSLVWIDCPPSVAGAGLVRALEKRNRIHQGPTPPGDVPSCVIICASGHEDLRERVRSYRELSPDSPPVLVFGSRLDLPLAHDALKAGASGFVHAEMTPDQLMRAVALAVEGELVAPRNLLPYLLAEEEPPNLAALSARQREILGYLVEGLSNAEIASRLFLSESTIKQHLRAAYKLLEVNNRTEAANLFRRSFE